MWVWGYQDFKKRNFRGAKIQSDDKTLFGTTNETKKGEREEVAGVYSDYT